MIGEQHYRKLERLYASARINGFYQPTLEVREGAAKVVIPIRPELHHAARAVHGSVYFKALDDACWFAAASLLERALVLTASFNIHLLRPVSEGALVAEARVVHASRRLFLAEGTLENDRGETLARGGGTFMRTETPLSPEIGYV
jgi:uncharacterized protein (TIGR00369 family)